MSYTVYLHLRSKCTAHLPWPFCDMPRSPGVLDLLKAPLNGVIDITPHDLKHHSISSFLSQESRIGVRHFLTEISGSP